MKKHLIKIVVILFLVGLGSIGYAFVKKVDDKQTVQASIQSLPAFSYQELSGGEFTNEDLDSEKPVILIYFNTECDYCQHEAAQISSSASLFKDSELLLISNESPDKIKEFVNTYKLPNNDYIHILQDSGASFATTFDVSSIPFSAIYDKDQQLIKTHKGAIKPSQLITIIK